MTGRGRPEGSLFNSYNTKVQGRALLLPLDCSTLPLIRTLYCWMLSREAPSTIFKVFGMTRPEDLPEAMNDRETWRERGSGISVLAARHDDDDDEFFALITIINRAVGLMNRVFANGTGVRGSIPGRVISKTQKWFLMPPCLTLSIIRYG